MNTASKTIRVLGFPAFSNRNSNSYNADFYEAVMHNSIHIDEFSFIRSLFVRYDIIHVHWPEKFLNSNYLIKAILWSSMLLFCLKFHQLRGGKVVWTVHNLKPHEIKYPRCFRLFWKLWLKTVDATFSLSHINQKIMFDTFDLPNAKYHKVIRLTLYEKPEIENAESILSDLGVSKTKPYCLFFGRILSYKNVEALIDIFKNNPPEGINLVVAGSCESESYKNEITARIDNSDNITFISRRTSDQELLALIQGCAIGIMPFKAIFNSGSLLQFPSYGKPAMTPYCDNFAEYGNLFKNSPFILYKNPLSKEIIEDAIKNLPTVDEACPKTLTAQETGINAAEFFRTIV